MLLLLPTSATVKTSDGGFGCPRVRRQPKCDVDWNATTPACKAVRGKDMWQNQLPATEIVDEIYYSTNFYSDQAVERIRGRDRDRPLYIHLTCAAPSSFWPCRFLFWAFCRLFPARTTARERVDRNHEKARGINKAWG